MFVLIFRYKALIGLLFYFLDRGQKLNASAEDREFCLKATSLYFILLGVPGSGAFKIFHPVLYNKALDTFKLALKLHLVSTMITRFYHVLSLTNRLSFSKGTLKSEEKTCKFKEAER